MKRSVLVVVLALSTVFVLPRCQRLAAWRSSQPVATPLTQVTTLQTPGELPGDEITALQHQLTAEAPVLALAPYVSITGSRLNGVKGPNVVFQGVNVHIRSTTTEGDTSGLGNLIIGWDTLPMGTLPVPFRNGSNNLVLGYGNNFTARWRRRRGLQGGQPQVRQRERRLREYSHRRLRQRQWRRGHTASGPYAG